MELYNYKAVVEYDGTNFFGFQAQPNELRTVQGELQNVLNKVFSNEKVIISYSGRTDAGVHSTGQVINFKSGKLFELSRLKWSLNSMLSNDISVKSIDFVGKDFDSRKNAIWREYKYYIVNDSYQNVFLKKYSILICKDLDVYLMDKACKCFVGEHDLRAFCSPNDANKSKIRNILEMDVEKKDNFHQKNIIIFRIRANAFLYNMARIIIGLIVEIGSKTRKISDIDRGFIDKDINYSECMIDAKGLFLSEVGYEVLI